MRSTELALQVLRKIVAAEFDPDGGYLDEDDGVIDVRLEFTDEEKGLIQRLRDEVAGA